jgi:hypothetical protein
MSQPVQLDMEVLQRIKFLMEYDVMKTSSENILVEQSTDLQKLAKEKGFGPVSLSKAQELYNQGKLGNTFDPISGQAKVLASRDPAVIKANQQKYGTIDVPRTDVSRMYSQIPQELKDQNLEEITQKVRDFMIDWRVGAVETFMAYIGVGVPVIITVNGFWMTLEIVQALKGNPDWWSLVFSILATVTAGSQAAALKPLYKLGSKFLSKGNNTLVGALDFLYQELKVLGGGARTSTGIFDDLYLAFNSIKPNESKLLNIFTSVINWLLTSKLSVGIKSILKWTLGVVKSFFSKIISIMDSGLTKLGVKMGMGVKSRKIGGAVRWGSGIGALGYGMTADTTSDGNLTGKQSDIIYQQKYTDAYKQNPGTFSNVNKQKDNP